ncbi:phage tail tip lysozyme [Carnobacterium maltaromaticum]|uniref:phage tail tip lysozyme n=1 Tax=Carnobacterium maltaromaticum TaxID=2751 RepID=UPI00191B9045|nr:phage tail tip lysozyme [Carnobacterium maltaromaticum]CAD5900562.1 Phage peptidoglycan binding endopeptidase [Carnobacterium maltaromaticum]
MNHIYLYDEFEKDFNHNGMTMIDFEDEPTIHRAINGIFLLEGVYQIGGQHHEHIKKGAILSAMCPDRTRQLFRIKNPGKTTTTISFTADHIAFDANRNFVESYFEANGSVSKIMAGIEGALTFPQRFNYSSNITTTHQFTINENYPIDAIMGQNNGGQNLVGITGGELDMDNFNIRLVDKLGSDRGFRFDWGINLENIKETVSAEIPVNSLYLIGAVPEVENYEEEQEPIVVKYLETEGVTVENRVIGKRTNSEAKTVEELTAWGQSLFDKDRIHEPKVSHEVSIIDLANTMEYKEFSNLVELQLGDTIHGTLQKQNITVQERMIEYTYYSRLSEYVTMTLGNDLGFYSSSVQNELTQIVSDMETRTNILVEKIINATNLITGTNGGYVRFRPKNNPSEILIMDTDNVNTAKNVWRWNLGGLGHSSTGVNGEYPTAMTSDGQIVADIITAGKFNAEMLRVGFNDIGDTLQIVNNALSIYNVKTKIMELTKQGLQFWNGARSVGTVGTFGDLFSWTAAESGWTNEMINILLSGGKAIQISAKKDYGMQFLPNGQINIKGDTMHQGPFAVGGDVNIVGSLKVNNVPITGGSGGGTGVPPSLTTEQEKNAWQVWSTLKGNGWTEQAVAGVLGNMQGESGIMPDKDEVGGGIGYGLVQWTSSTGIPGRQYVQQKLAQAGIAGDYRTVAVQLKLLEWDMDNGQYIPTSSYPYSAAQFRQLTDIATAARAFERNFERPENLHPERVGYAQNWYNKLHGLTGGTFGIPVPVPYYVSSPYGQREGEFHKGIDFAAAENTPIYASDSGRVVHASFNNGGFGYYVCIEHSNGLYTGYAHMNNTMVSVGQQVSKGQQVGLMGNTGASQGVHLHFNVSDGLFGNYRDPAPLLGI